MEEPTKEPLLALLVRAAGCEPTDRGSIPGDARFSRLSRGTLSPTHAGWPSVELCHPAHVGRDFIPYHGTRRTGGLPSDYPEVRPKDWTGFFPRFPPSCLEEKTETRFMEPITYRDRTSQKACCSLAIAAPDRADGAIVGPTRLCERVREKDLELRGLKALLKIRVRDACPTRRAGGSLVL